MTTPYPIVAQYELDDPVKRGPLGLIKRRDNGDIPKIKPHEVLIWRVGGKYIVDRRELRAHDDTVVRASSVSVVSVRPGTEVEVSFRIDSEDNSEFTVKVTFICSVLDPVIVVRDGQVNAADALLAYLRGYQDLFNLGLEHPISEINKVRTKMGVQVKSYMTLRPPKIPGMEITSATVQVETPTVLADIGKLANEQLIELQKQQAADLLDTRRQSHLLEKRAMMSEAVGHDPNAALHLAYADGGMTSQELAERLQQADEAHQEREQVERLAATTRRYAVEDRDAQWDHDGRKAEVEWQRSQAELERQDAQQRRRDELEANIKLLQMFAERGHLDTHYEDIGDLIRRIRGEATTAGPAVAAGDPAALTDGAGRVPGSHEPEGDHDN